MRSLDQIWQLVARLWPGEKGRILREIGTQAQRLRSDLVEGGGSFIGVDVPGFSSNLDEALFEIAAAGGGAPTWDSISGKPSTFPPSAHTHPLSDLSVSGATAGQVPAWSGTEWEPVTPATGAAPAGSDLQLQYRVDATTFGGASLWRVNANTIAQHNGANAQVWQLFRTRTDGANGEWLEANSANPSGFTWMRLQARSNGDGDDNISIALSPLGLGAISAQVPDGTAAGGNARGDGAVDWQTVRVGATAVASGVRSVIGGGENNTASNTRSTVAGGLDNLASGDRSVVAGGQGNVASGTLSVVGGGQGNVASGILSSIPGGVRGTTRGIHGARAHSSGSPFSAVGAIQLLGVTVWGQTSGATQEDLTSDGLSLSNTNTLQLEQNSVWSGRVMVNAVSTDGDIASWIYDAIFTRGLVAVEIRAQTLVASYTPAWITGALTGINAAAVDGYVACSPTGVASKDITWACDFDGLQTLISP